MRNLIMIVFLCLALMPSAFAVHFKVQGVAGVLIYQATVQSRSTVGEVTDALLSSALISRLVTEYAGSRNGVSSVNRLGTTMEVISDQLMYAYGWCYTVDGIESGKLAGEYILDGKEKEIRWFYAYAIFDHGKWTEMCVTAEHVPSSKVRQLTLK